MCPSPEFSVIITCHNQAAFIDDAVLSVLTQRHADKEVIVVDDASTDRSSDVLEKYASRVRLIELAENVGANRAPRNLGAAAANGAYLVFLDGDDLLLPWALEMYADVLKHQQASVVLGSLLWFEDQPPSPHYPEDVPAEIKFVSYKTLIEKDRSYRPSASATVIERHTFHRVQGWTNDIFPLEDLELLVKVSCGDAIQIVSPPATAYRYHAANSIRTIPPFLGVLSRMIEKVNRSEYPCGRLHRLATYAFIGGPTFFWAKRAYRNGLRKEALRLVGSGWVMILAAGIYKSRTLLKGRRPIESIPLHCSLSG